MAKIPAIASDPTLDAARAAAEERGNTEKRRGYLGMSSIGQSCERRLWYYFRWAAREQFDAATLWRFEDGHRSEDVMAERLRMVPGLKLRTIDPRTGGQIGWKDLGGHFSGHADGLLTGLVQAPSALHVWEAKAVNDKKLAKLAKLKAADEKTALQKWDPVYYAQAILYMAYAEAPRHYLTASTPGARDMIGVRTDSDLDEARRLRARAERIITATEPLPRISEDPAWYECKWCPFQNICHGSQLPDVNARTCVHATPEMDGDARWSCAKCDRDLTTEEQEQPCEHHLYIPALVSYAQQVDANEAENWIEYRLPNGTTFRNGSTPGPNTYTSKELQAMNPSMIGDPGAEHLRAELGARHVSPLTRPDWFKGAA